MLRALLLLSLCWLVIGDVRSAPVVTPHAVAELVAETRHARPGHPVTVALRLAHEAGWHTYWKNPGDSGMPTRLTWTLPPGVRAGPIQWPVPERIAVGPLMNYGYSGETWLLTDVSVPAGWKAGTPLPIRVRADWLICKELCLPGGADLSVDLAVATARPSPDPQWGAAIERARRALPRPDPAFRPRVVVGETHIELDLGSMAAPPARLEFFPAEPEILENPAPQRVERTGDAYRLLLTTAPAFKGSIPELKGLLVMAPGPTGPEGVRAVEIAVPYPGGVPRNAVRPQQDAPALSADQIRAAASQGPPLGLLAALGLAFVGGLILNLMPCVFPVVSIKVLGFVDQAHGDRAQLRRHGLAFAAGIVACFWLVAGALLMLRAGGQALGWGYQLQSPPVVAFLAVLFFLLGLNLSGFFEIGTRVQTLAGDVRHRGGLAGAFLSGVLATVVATPCTAPFMGAALGFALTQPPFASMAVFTALALGMAAPYVLLTLVPRLTQWLPRPGRWMETLKQLLAFPLYLTVVWLVWVLGQQAGMTAAARLLAGLVLMTAAIWAWRRFGGLARPIGAAFALLLAVAAAVVAAPGAETAAKRSETATTGWTPYSEDALAAARAKGPVFVDFTAAWCVTCQVNKRVVLDRDEMVAAFESAGFTRLRADWTSRDETITAALARLGRSGVPVYAVYPKGSASPELLAELLTREEVLNAIRRASGGAR